MTLDDPVRRKSQMNAIFLSSKVVYFKDALKKVEKKETRPISLPFRKGRLLTEAPFKHITVWVIHPKQEPQYDI